MLILTQRKKGKGESASHDLKKQASFSPHFLTDLTYEEAVAELKKHYDGYHFSKKMTDIFNPFSLLKALPRKKSPLLPSQEERGFAI